MGLRDWFTDPFGLKALAASQGAERQLTREMLNKVVQITQQQVETAARMSIVLEQHTAALNHDGIPPEGRHWTEELEAEAWEQRNGTN